MARPSSADDVFRAIADPTRRRILEQLAGGERPVSELAIEFDVSLPAISQHLKILRDANLVRARRQGRERIYALRPAALREVAEWSELFAQLWRGKLANLDKYLRRNTQ